MSEFTVAEVQLEEAIPLTAPENVVTTKKFNDSGLKPQQLSQPHDIKHVYQYEELVRLQLQSKSLKDCRTFRMILHVSRQYCLHLATEYSFCSKRALSCPIKPVLTCDLPGSHRFLETCTVYFICTLNKVFRCCVENEKATEIQHTPPKS